MIRDFIIKLQSAFVSDEDIAAYETTIPSKLHLSYTKDGDMYIGFIDEIDGEKIQGLLTTQAKDYDTFVYNVNQLAYMYVDMPEKIRPHYGNKFQPPASTTTKAKGVLTLQKA